MSQQLNVLGIDIAKRVYQLVGTDQRGHVVLRKRLSRAELLPFTAQLPPVLIGMEVCGGSHYLAKQLQGQGHEVKLMAPQHVKPYNPGNKNDSRDAEAIAEAVTRPKMRFVPIKAVEQQDIQALHRIRDRLVKSRTALVNELHGLLGEYGIVLPKGIGAFRKAYWSKLEAEQDKLSGLAHEVFSKLFEELTQVHEQVSYYEGKIKAIAKSHPECQRLQSIPGIGPLTATAVVAAVGDAQGFKNGRHFSAWLGLVPRQHSSGHKEKLLGISKRGDSYLRRLLIHGGRSTLRWVSLKRDGRSQWIEAVMERRGKNRAAVAVANKNARIVWALLRHGGVYEAGHAQGDRDGK